MQVAVIGAGMAGSACARALSDAGVPVTVVDKARSVGGRMAQRHVGGRAFDHGAQYFTIRDAGFGALAERWTEAGLCAPWPQASATGGAPVWIGTPSMGATVKALLEPVPVRLGAAVAAIGKDRAGWSLRLQDGGTLGPFARLVLAMPAPQTRTLLLSAGLGRCAAALEGVDMAPCWTVIAGYARLTGLDMALRFPPGSDLAWAARNDTKPGRTGTESWTFHAGPEWSAAHLEETAADVAHMLLERAAGELGAGLAAPDLLLAHRWRYALVTRALGSDYLLWPELGLAACGDWCLAARVEAAWLSGRALGRALAG